MSTNDSPTAQPTTKRTRINEDGNETIEIDMSSPASSLSTPMAVAKRHVEFCARSLHKDVQSLVKSAHGTYLSLMKRKTEQASKLAKFADDEYFPNSIKNKFSLTTKDQYKEDATFVELVGEGEATITKFKLEMKKTIKKKIEFELSCLHRETRACFFLAVKNISRLMLRTNKKWRTATIDARVVAKYMLEKCYTEDTLGVHLPFTQGSLFTEFKTWSKETEEYQPGSTPESVSKMVDDILPTTKPIIEAIFHASWNKYLEAVEIREIDAAIKKELREIQLEEGTKDVEMELNKEGTMDTTNMNEVIEKKVEKRLASMQKQLDKQQQQLRSYKSHQSAKDTRGANSNTKGKGASNKKKSNANGNNKNKKKTAKTTAGKNQQKNQNAAAAASDNVTSNDNKQTKPKKKNGKRNGSKKQQQRK